MGLIIVVADIDSFDTRAIDQIMKKPGRGIIGVNRSQAVREHEMGVANRVIFWISERSEEMVKLATQKVVANPQKYAVAVNLNGDLNLDVLEVIKVAMENGAPIFTDLMIAIDWVT